MNKITKKNKSNKSNKSKYRKTKTNKIRLYGGARVGSLTRTAEGERRFKDRDLKMGGITRNAEGDKRFGGITKNKEGGIRGKKARKFFLDEAGKARLDAQDAISKADTAAREKELKDRKQRSKEHDKKIYKEEVLKAKQEILDDKIRYAKTPEEKEKLRAEKKKMVEAKKKEIDDEDLLRIQKYDCTSKSHYMDGMKESRLIKRKIKKYFANARPASTSTSMGDLVKELVKINMRFDKCRGRDINDEKPFYVGQSGRIVVPRAKRRDYKSLSRGALNIRRHVEN